MRCHSANANTVAACSRIIVAPSTSDYDRTLALGPHADAARAQGDMPAALADCDGQKTRP
jgi:hypothetical protein